MRFLFVLLCLLGACTSQKTVKVAATATPHAEMLAFIKPDLKEKGINLEIVEVDDYQLPNRLLYEKQVDANFFQHLPFLQSVEKEYDNSLVPLIQVHAEPLGIYSKRITSLAELKKESTVAIPCDPSNETRALLFLASQGLLEIQNKKTYLTVLDVSTNLKLKEIDSPLLPRILPDVDIAVIPANFALQGRLSKPIALESSTAYPNVFVVRKGEEGREDLQLIAHALTSEKMKKFLREKYGSAIIPLF